MNTLQQHVVVTGAAGGIGSVLVAALVQRGHTVSAWDVDETKLAATRSSVGDAASLVVQRCDTSDFDEVESAWQKAEAEGGPITGLVAVAGGAAGERAPFLELTPELWNRTITRNLTTAFNCTLVAGRAMAARGSGSIVLFGSTAAASATPGLAAYGTAKSGIRQLMRSAALELAPSGVRVNAVSPGIIETDANRALITGAETGLVARIPQGRAGQASELVGAISYLLGDDASFTTGAWLDVDGGYTLS